MKKLLSTFLAILFATNIVYASEITVTIPEQKELVEDKYIISVDIMDNPGFASLQIELFYNDDVLTCEKVLPGDVIKGMLTDSNPKAEAEKTSAILSVAGINNTTENGSLASFVFEKPKAGNPKIEFLLVELMTADGKKADCEVKVTDNYGEFEDVPEATPPTGSGEIVNPPTDDGSQEENPPGSSGGGSSSGGGIWKPSTPSNSDTGGNVIHDEALTPTITFTDVSNHWASEYIAEAVTLDIVNGMPDGTFAPDKEMTRAEFATILWNMAEKPDTESTSAFNDVKSEDWYYKQIAWAYDKGYINGISNAEFNPNGTITREQAMTILYRYAGSLESTEKLDAFNDKESISDFAYPAMCWAVENKIISGVSDTEIAPKMSATRAQLATIIVRYLKR